MTVPNLDQSAPVTPALPGEELASKSEKPCPECGEKVRSGMVRCWNCGAFMNRDLEAKFQKMQAQPKKIMLSMSDGDAKGRAGMTTEPAAKVEEEDDDFTYTLSMPGDKPVLHADNPAPPPGAKAEAEKPAAPAKVEAPKKDKDGKELSHSEASGGDVLLNIAMQEQTEVREKRKKRKLMAPGAKTPGGFLIFCPWGCRIEVKEQHRGMQGKCPRCKAPFIVPTDPPAYLTEKKDEASLAAAATAATGGFQLWLNDWHWHVVSPEKLKLVAESLAKEFVEVDLGFGTDGLWVITLAKKAGGLFGGGGDKKKEAREALLRYLGEGSPVPAMPAMEKRLYTPVQMHEFRVVQPVANRLTSMFAGVPVFGIGRVAVQVPLTDDVPIPQFFSCGLLEFRRFAAALTEFYGITGLGENSGLPPEDVYVEHKCHFSGSPVRALQHLEYYQVDPTAKLVLSGWQCIACGLTMCEPARNKENIGGKGGKAIAKAKCPKCKQKLGERPLYTLPVAASELMITGETQPAMPDAAAPAVPPAG